MILPSGNAGLATAGTGDVLAGVLTALLCHLEPMTAAGFGAYIHSKAADVARQSMGSMGMIARDVVAAIPQVLREIENEKAH